MARWFTETFEGVRFALEVERTLVRRRSDFQTIEIFASRQMGRVLALDGVLQTSEVDEHLYHEMLVHPALTTCRVPRRVLVVGGGDGGTAREVLRHPEVERVELVEIDGEVLRACQEHLPTLGAWDDPRLQVIVGDGAEHVRRAASDAYDVVLMDGTDPVGPGAALFGDAFVADVRRALAPGGVFAQQSASPLLMPEVFTSAVRTARAAFAHAHPCFGPVPLYAAGVWSWTVASDDLDPREVDATRAERIAASGTRHYNAAIHRAAFALPQALRRQL